MDGYYGTEKVRLNRTPITAYQCPMLFVTKQKAKGMGSDGIAGFGVSDVTFLDIAYDRQQISSRVFILRLQHNDAPSGMYYNQLPSDILDRTRYVPLSHHQVWVNVVSNQAACRLHRSYGRRLGLLLRRRQ